MLADMWRRKKNKKDDSDSPTDSEDSGSEGTVFVDPVPAHTGKTLYFLEVSKPRTLKEEDEEAEEDEVRLQQADPVAWNDSLIDSDEEVPMLFNIFNKSKLHTMIKGINYRSESCSTS